MYSIATPVSSLFSNNKNYERIIKYSDCLELREEYPIKNLKINKLFHFEFQPIHSLTNSDFDFIEKIIEKYKYLELISFHMASCYDKPFIENGVYVPGGKMYTPDEMFINAKKNFSIINEILGDSIKIAVENNNYYKTDAYKYIADPNFIEKIVLDNNIYFLYDLAHGGISAYNLGINYNKYLNALPLKRIIQLHICRKGFKNNHAYDAHFMPDNLVYREVSYLIKNSKNLKYLTLEYYRNIDSLIKGLVNLRKIIKSHE